MNGSTVRVQTGTAGWDVDRSDSDTPSLGLSACSQRLWDDLKRDSETL